ncbi:hypothetical protein AR687_24365 [Flavobacteriaceae bacterium CRH]|nr:hypothetical protein AR687_24365 [Flavobacteriaceae bacterium CRH]
MTRNIPKTVREILRKEVNFGCPVENCGSPYLSYHHFNPPWHIKEHHDSEGMIALCLEHHKQADYGAFTDSQLNKLKAEPFLTKNDKVSGQFNWKRENLVFLLGGNIYLKSQNIYLYEKEPLLWLTNDNQNNTLLNFDIKAESGEIIFSMRNNDWITISEFDDIESIPSGKKLFVENIKEKIKIEIEFNNLTKIEFYQKYRNEIPEKWMVAIFQMITEDTLTVCSVNGYLTYPFEISLKKEGTKISGIGKEITIMGSLKMNDVQEMNIQTCFSVGDNVIVK